MEYPIFLLGEMFKENWFKMVKAEFLFSLVEKSKAGWPGGEQSLPRERGSPSEKFSFLN